MTIRRSAPGLAWQTAVSLAALILAPALSAAPKPGKAPARATPPAETHPAVPVTASPSTPAEIADAHPSSRPATPDLHLTKDAERKADALTAFAQGLLLEDAAEGDAALASFRKAFDLDASNAELAVKLAFMLAQRNDATGGIEILKDSIKASPKEPLPLIYLSQLYAKYLKKPETGIRYAEQALALDPELYPAYLALYELFAVTNQPARIEQLLQRAIKSTSTNAQFWLQIGGLAQQAHLKEDGTASSPEALTQMNAIFAKAGVLGDSDALVQARVGNYYIDSKQTDRSIPYYLAALSLKQTSDDPILVNAGEKLARALNETGQQAKAIEVLEKITTENPARFETFELLGELYQKQGDFDKALTNFKHSTLLDESEPRNHVRVAQLQLQLKRFDEAVETAAAARKKFPDSPEALFLQAFTLSQAKRHMDALRVYSEALADFENNHEELLTPQFFFEYGATAEQAGIYDKAEQMLRRAIELDPGTSTAAQASNYLGYMWVDRGENLDEGGDLIKKAVAMEPDNGAFLDSLGWFYFKKGDSEKALTQLLKAMEVTKPEDATILEHVGDVYQQMSRTAQALQYWQKAAALDSTNTKIAEKIEAAKQKVSSNTAAPKIEVPPVPVQ